MPPPKKKNRQSVIIQKNFARRGPKNFAQATKAGKFIIKKCGWKIPWKNENAVSASRLKIARRVVARRGKRR